MKNRSHRCNVNGPKPKHGHNFPMNLIHLNYNTNYSVSQKHPPEVFC